MIFFDKMWTLYIICILNRWKISQYFAKKTMVLVCNRKLEGAVIGRQRSKLIEVRWENYYWKEIQRNNIFFHQISKEIDSEWSNNSFLIKISSIIFCKRTFDVYLHSYMIFVAKMTIQITLLNFFLWKHKFNQFTKFFLSKVQIHAYFLDFFTSNSFDFKNFQVKMKI